MCVKTDWVDMASSTDLVGSERVQAGTTRTQTNESTQQIVRFHIILLMHIPFIHLIWVMFSVLLDLSFFFKYDRYTR